MEMKGKVIVVTGGGSGIGAALCRRFAHEGAEAVVVADLDDAKARQVAEAIGAPAHAAPRVDVSAAAEVQRLVDDTTARFGRIDVFCSNAGIITRGGLDTTDDDWSLIWGVNTMAHVYAARAVIPQMLARGEGYLLQTASAAGLLSQVDSASYSVTKHAAVGFAEWLSINYGDKGIRVSCLCPQGVRTPMLLGEQGTRKSFLSEGAVTPEHVAEETIRAMREERFLVLPHPEVREYMQRKTADYDRWLRGMRRVRDQAAAAKLANG